MLQFIKNGTREEEDNPSVEDEPEQLNNDNEEEPKQSPLGSFFNALLK